MISVIGYDLLNGGKDGIRYAWKDDKDGPYIESAAFVNKTKSINSDICGYTTSVSKGCILTEKKQQCRFCRTGNNLPFRGVLTAQEIAKQNIFMVLTDIYCDDHPELKNKKREFAYMGQGEPGFSYRQVREAIEITNAAMKELQQTVYRHIFATCGIPKAIQQYAEDIQGFYTERVTLHLSLHAGRRRSIIMPINDTFPYEEALIELNKIYDISKEKPCIGIMLFNKYTPYGLQDVYSNNIEEVLSIVKKLDPNKCRLSFCEFNPSSELGNASIYPEEEAKELLRVVKSMGFDAKLFSSFGQKEQTACGMLGGKQPEYIASEKWKMLDKMASEMTNKYTTEKEIYL